MMLLWFALLLCPPEFRARYRDEIYADAKRVGWFRAALDAASAGIGMRAEEFARDVRFALRSLRKSPLHTCIFVLTIAIAIGMNLSVGAAIEGMVLRPLPYPHSERLLFVQETNGGHSVSYPDAERIRRRMRPYGDLALAAFESASLEGRGLPVELTGGLVSNNYFAVIGIHPVLGRFFEDGLRDRRSVVISRTLWLDRFAGAPSVLGKLLNLDGTAYTIIGVAPAGFLDPSPFGLIRREYWRPIDRSDEAQINAGNFNYNAVARIRPGVKVATAQSAIAAITKAVQMNRPADRQSCCVQVGRIGNVVLGPVRVLLLFLYAAVSIVLLIACVNIANLQMSRNVARRGELAVREAIGARRRHIISQLSVETGLLASLGAVLGLGFAWMIIHAVDGVVSRFLPRWDEVRIDGGLVAYACLLVAVAVFASGILPALLNRRHLESSALSGAGRGGNLNNRRLTRSLLITAEVALATVVVIAAGLVLNSFFTLTNVDYGFNPRGLYLVQMPQPQHEHEQGAGVPRSTAEIATMAATLTQRLAQIPGVRSVSASLSVPFWCCDRMSFRIPGRPDAPTAFYDAVTPGYFHTVGITRLQGRGFLPSDRKGAACAVVVNAAFARRYLGGVSAVGRGVINGTQRCTVVGVVGNTVEEYGKTGVPIIYLSMAQDPELALLAIRTDRRIPDLAAQVDAATFKAYPALPQPRVYAIQSLVAQNAFVPKTAMIVFCVLAAIALALALAGVYAVVSWSVVQRTHEFGIRKALGAPASRLVLSVTGATLAQGAMGIAAGIVVAALLARAGSGLLYQTSPLQPSVYVAVIVLLCGCVSGAALLPALRAALVHPAVALRYE